MDPTDTVIRWALATPVLASRLKEIAEDGLRDPEGMQELGCTVIELLMPERDERARAYLKATGARSEDADAVWRALAETQQGYAVDWDRVGRELIRCAHTW
jgi:hypothetical protein